MSSRSPSGVALALFLLLAVPVRVAADPGPALTVDEPSQGALAVRFTSGATTWCAVFGGRVQRDSGTDPPVPDGAGRFQAKDAPAPAACPAAPDSCP